MYFSGGRLHLLQHHRRNLRRGELLVPDEDLDAAVVLPLRLIRGGLTFVGDLVEATAHEPLDGKDGVRRVRDRLPLRNFSDETLAGLRNAHDRGGRTAAFGVGDDGGLPALHHGDNRVGRPQINTDDLAHGSSGLLIRGIARGRFSRLIRVQRQRRDRS